MRSFRVRGRGTWKHESGVTAQLEQVTSIKPTSGCLETGQNKCNTGTSMVRSPSIHSGCPMLWTSSGHPEWMVDGAGLHVLLSQPRSVPSFHLRSRRRLVPARQEEHRCHSLHLWISRRIALGTPTNRVFFVSVKCFLQALSGKVQAN